MTSPPSNTNGSLATPAPWWKFALVGVIGGLLAGTFGIGGGVIMVPALVILTHLNQRQAAATSLASIIPAATFGGIFYAAAGNVEWLAAGILAVGGAIGVQIGTYLMSRIPQTALVLAFAVFQILIIISLWAFVPSRGQEILWGPWTVVLLSIVGLVTGIVSGLIGIGGGIIVVPALIVLVGASDLVAKGTSLLMIIPSSLSGTIANFRRGYLDVRAAVITGVVAAAVSPLGGLLANTMTPLVSNILLACFIALSMVNLLLSHFGVFKKKS